MSVSNPLVRATRRRQAAMRQIFKGLKTAARTCTTKELLSLFYPKKENHTAIAAAANRRSYAAAWIRLLPEQTAKQRATKAALLLRGDG